MKENIDYSTTKFTITDLKKVTAEIKILGMGINPLPVGEIVEDFYGEVPRNGRVIFKAGME